MKKKFLLLLIEKQRPPYELEIIFLEIKLIIKKVTDYNFAEIGFSPFNTNWHTAFYRSV
jgi:hypothetical protein